MCWCLCHLPRTVDFHHRKQEEDEKEKKEGRDCCAKWQGSRAPHVHPFPAITTVLHTHTYTRATSDATFGRQNKKTIP